MVQEEKLVRLDLKAKRESKEYLAWLVIQDYQGKKEIKELQELLDHRVKKETGYESSTY